MEQTYSPVPAQWDNGKFEIDFNCVVYAQDESLIIISDEGIDDLDAKIEANVAAYEQYLTDKAAGESTLESLGLTPEQLKALGL